jgi:kumamolisin
VAALSAGGGVLAAGGASQSGPDRPGTGPRLVAATAPGATVDFALSLRQDRAAVARFLRALEDPSSPRFHRFLSPAGFGARFGISTAELRRVRAALHAAGLTITADVPQRTTLGVRGRAAYVERFLGTRLNEWVGGDGRRYRVPAGRPRLPGALRGAVTAATGLDTRPRYRGLAVPAGGLKPRDAARAYNVAGLHARGVRGQGQAIAILSYDSFDPADVATYDRLAGIRGAPPVERIAVAGPVHPGDGQDEVNLDIDVIRGVAPEARILNYEMVNDGRPMAVAIDRIVADGRVQVISNSWGACAAAYPSDLQRQDDASLAAAAARGITMYVASGDAGSYDCQHSNPQDTRVSVDWPSSSPHAVAVGGTLLSVRRDSSYLSETGWEDPLSAGGGGGGLSTAYPRPSWQRGPGVQNRFSTGRRQVPDVAASADGDSGWFVVTQGRQAKIGGTSAAAPFWAASMLLVGEHAQRQGAGRVGFSAPLLYRIAARANSPFNDVVAGGNRGYRATPGWDYATGWGSADVTRLADAVAADLRASR